MKKVIISFFLALPVLLAAQPEDFPSKPYAWVNDFADLLNEQEEYGLNKKLATYEDSTSTQIFIVTMNDHGGVPIEQMGAELGEKWGVGQKGSDNGMIILIYPEDHMITIQTGYGLEEYVPDAIAKRIIENEIKPAFRNEQYAAGLDQATEVIMGLLSGKFTASEYGNSGSQGTGAVAGVLFIIFLFFIIFGNSRKRRYSSMGKNLPFWIALSMLSNSRHGHSGSWGSFNSGSGSFGGGGFGGFGGGGGGSFGGGGASGSW